MAKDAIEAAGRQASRAQSRQIPGHLVAKEFGKVYVRDDGPLRHVELTIWIRELTGALAEGWQTGVALDASASMKDWYGKNLQGQIPAAVLDDYRARGWVSSHKYDGAEGLSFKQEAYEDALKKKYVSFTDNIVEPLARDFIGYLAQELDSLGKVSVVYWACGDGSAYEQLGDFTPGQCKSLDIKGPKKVSFGNGTRLTPCMRYFVERFKDAKRGMYVFLTDGRLDDLEDVKRYTTEVARSIHAGKRNFLKCVLIGVGSSIDEAQMEQLDDLDTGTDVDIWDHKVASEMRALSEIMVEVVGGMVDIAAEIVDASGAVVARFTDGLPQTVSFTLSSQSAYFELLIAGRKIRQQVAP